LALISAAVAALIFPARSLRVVPEMAALAWLGFSIENDLPGPAKSLFGSRLRVVVFSLAIGTFLTVNCLKYRD
jgi:hypothetical protein